MQVDKSHYEFKKYVNKNRWLTFWHQIDEVVKLNPNEILEIGVGSGVFSVIIRHVGLHIETVDIDPELNPDHIASAVKLPFEENSFDCVCAFEMLEHLPYKDALKAFFGMVRVAKKHVVISLPDAKTLWTYSLHIPKFGRKTIHVPRPTLGAPRPHVFDGEHHWEINKKGFPLQKVMDDFTQQAKLVRTYRVLESTYHRFFVFQKK